MKYGIFVFILFVFAVNGPAQTPSNTATLLRGSALNEEQLHAAIIDSVDSRKFSEAAQLLEALKQKYPERYQSLPYILLHARSYALSKDLTRANALYRSALQDSKLARFVYLPIARIAVVQGKTADAIEFYRKYLSDKTSPDYTIVATEALDYCVMQNHTNDAISLAQLIQKQPNSARLARFYIAKANATNKDLQTAKKLFRELIRAPQRDDIASLALTELDKLEGNQLSQEEKIDRSKIAHDVWNFSLVKKYLEGLSSTEIRNAYYYGRALTFLGDYEGAKKVFQIAADTWPEDPMSRYCLYQYAATSLRQGDFAKAEEVFKRLIQDPKSSLTQTATFKLVEVFRTQARFAEALQVLDSYQSRRGADKHRSGFLKARIYFQMNRHADALTEFNRLLASKNVPNKKELLVWKGVVLKNMNKKKEAADVFASVRSGYDYYGLLASEQLEELGVTPAEAVPVTIENFEPLQLPDREREAQIQELSGSGDLLPAFLYLHLYEESTPLLKSISSETWKLLSIDPKNASRRYLALAQLAGLSGVYSNANYYSEIFLERLPGQGATISLSEDLLKILFPLPYNEEIVKYSKDRNIDPFLVLSIMKQESKFKQFAKSPAFARGLMQLIPSTATQLAADLKLADFSIDQLYHPETNINLGTKYVQDMVNRFGNRLEVIAASYNGGESNAKIWLSCTSTKEPIEFFSNIDLPETRTYVMKVRMNYEWYKRVYGKPTTMAFASAGGD